MPLSDLLGALYAPMHHCQYAPLHQQFVSFHTHKVATVPLNCYNITATQGNSGNTENSKKSRKVLFDVKCRLKSISFSLAHLMGNADVLLFGTHVLCICHSVIVKTKNLYDSHQVLNIICICNNIIINNHTYSFRVASFLI